MNPKKMAAWLRAGPLFPLIPIVPAVILVSSVLLSIFSLRRARQLQAGEPSPA
jgi:hypothetical protein